MLHCIVVCCIGLSYDEFVCMLLCCAFNLLSRAVLYCVVLVLLYCVALLYVVLCCGGLCYIVLMCVALRCTKMC